MSEPMKNPPARKTQTAKRNYQKEMEKVLDAAVRDGRVPTLFLHSCCAPCSSYVLEYLSQYFSITVFYYNPNISPKEEYEARTEEVQRLIRELPAVHPIRFVEGKYDPECYYEAVRGHEKDPEGGERCGICFEMRLREAAKLAAEGGYDWFTTTSKKEDIEKNFTHDQSAQKCRAPQYDRAGDGRRVSCGISAVGFQEKRGI